MNALLMDMGDGVCLLADWLCSNSHSPAFTVQLQSQWGVIQLFVILHICQLNLNIKCKIVHRGTLWGFVTLPRGCWIYIPTKDS